MTTDEVIRRAQLAVHAQGGDDTEEVLRRLDQLRVALGYVEDIKRYADRVNAVVNPLEGVEGRGS